MLGILRCVIHLPVVKPVNAGKLSTMLPALHPRLQVGDDLGLFLRGHRCAHRAI